MDERFSGISDVVGGGLPDVVLAPETTALMIIDMQRVDADRDAGLGARARDLGLEAEVEGYYRRLEEIVVPAQQRLLELARAAGLTVVHVRNMCLTQDGRDAGWRHKRFAMTVPATAKEAEFIEPLSPLPNELVLNKTTSNVFVSTNADFVLRNIGIRALIVCGVVTNNCVESSVRGAADIGYEVVIAEDGCAAWTTEGHAYALGHLHRNFAIVTTTDVLERQLRAATPAAAGQRVGGR